MSRRQFRGSVDTPRPAAAWLMSIVASGTLWITELLPFWVIAIQLVAFAVSYATRHDPPAFRRNPIWLNIGMLGITTVTIRSALEGNPASLSLAFFSALAQGLQLMDARPRRSEFLLVALALFQVILASNLTDSILFPPLVLIFLASVTWTLLVHTLQIEAAEAGDPGAASRAIRKDLIRMTSGATSGCVVLALMLFMLLPRIKNNMLHGSTSGGLAISGFSDSVRLGEVGRIRKDHATVLRVEGLDGELPEAQDAYWRGLAFDAFDGHSWSISDAEHAASRRLVAGVGRFGIVLEPPSAGTGIAQRITREPVKGGVLFTPGQAQRIQGPFQRIERDANGAIYLSGPSDERIRYDVWAQPAERRDKILELDHASAPIESARGGRRPTERYFALPDLDSRIEQLAARMTEGAASDFEAARLIERELRESGHYTDDPPELGGEGSSPVEDFLLGGVEGHCEYFASAMVVLARTQGLPARLVNGFAGGVPNSVGRFVEVTQADAHTWVEIHFEKAGWVRFDPTPPDLRLRAMDQILLWTRVADLGSAIELWWFQRVVDFDSADQIGALRGLWMAWKGTAAEDTPESSAATTRATDPLAWPTELNRYASPILVLLGLAGVLAGLAVRRTPTTDAVPTSYRSALKLLARRGWKRGESTSARDFANRLEGVLPGKGALAFHRITECYLAERFGESEQQDLAAELAALKSAVDRMGLRNQSNVV